LPLLIQQFNVPESIKIWLSSPLVFFTTAIGAIAGFITLLIITIGNISQLDIVFRDIAILFMALTLIALSYKKWDQNL